MDRNYWERKGRAYDAEIFDVYAEDRRGIVASTLRRLAANAGHAADLGCGTGKALPLLAATARHVEAVDLSASCLKEARLACAAWKNISYRRADLSRDRARGLLDFILSVNVLIMPDEQVRRGIFRTIVRRLKPGGRCLIVVPSLESSLWVAQQLFRWEQKDGVGREQAFRTVRQLLGDRFHPALAEGIVPIDGVPTKHYLAEELGHTFDQQGIRLLKLTPVRYAWRTEFENPPGWMGAPYPWDWMAVGEKIRR